MSSSPFPRTELSYGLGDRSARSRVAVQDRDPDLELSDLSVEVSGHEALTEEFDAVHLRFCAAAAVILGPFSPECPPGILAGSYGFIPNDSTRCCWFPKLSVFARRDDC